MLDALVRGMLVDQPGDNFSILQASEWMNRPEIREHYEIGPFNPKTLYRAVEMVGQNQEKRIYALQDIVLKLLGGPKMDVLLDWTSIVYCGDMSKLVMFADSRHHNLGECQLTLGVAQLSPPYDLLVGLTIEAGNLVGVVNTEMILRLIGYRVGVKENSSMAFVHFLKDTLKEEVEDIMILKVRSVKKETPLAEALKNMIDFHLNGLPVVDDDYKLIGELMSSELFIAAKRLFESA